MDLINNGSGALGAFSDLCFRLQDLCLDQLIPNKEHMIFRLGCKWISRENPNMGIVVLLALSFLELHAHLAQLHVAEDGIVVASKAKSGPTIAPN